MLLPDTFSHVSANDVLWPAIMGFEATNHSRMRGNLLLEKHSVAAFLGSRSNAL